MVGRTRPRRVPAEPALLVGDGDVVDARVPPRHQPTVVEQPVLVAVGTEPGSRLVVPLVAEPHRDPIGVEGPHLLDEPVVELLGPLAREELDDRVAPGEELRPVPPPAPGRVRERNPLWVAGVPPVL